MYDENELVRLAAEDDIGAFEKLVALYEKRVYTMALRMTGNPDDAFGYITGGLYSRAPLH